MIDVSVIIPVYNTESYIEETIKSVADQEMKNYEIIVVDDGSQLHILLSVPSHTSHPPHPLPFLPIPLISSFFLSISFLSSSSPPRHFYFPMC